MTTRPPKNGEPVLDRTIKTRIASEDWATIQAAAAKAGLPATTYMRRKALAAAKRATK